MYKDFKFKHIALQTGKFGLANQSGKTVKEKSKITYQFDDFYTFVENCRDGLSAYIACSAFPGGGTDRYC